MIETTRRSLLTSLAATAAWVRLPGFARAKQPQASSNVDGSAMRVDWSDTRDRVFLSGQCWANPMEDWAVVDGAAECLSGRSQRNIHLLTHQLTNPRGEFKMSVTLSQAEAGERDGGAGFEIGVRSELNEYRSNAFAHNGVQAGVANGALILGGEKLVDNKLAKPQEFRLRLSGKPSSDGYLLRLVALGKSGDEIARIAITVESEAILGNVALMNNYGKGNPQNNRRGGSRYRFNDWAASGSAFTVNEEQRFGPILWSMYSLSDSRGDDGFVMKMTVLTAPLHEDGNQNVELFVRNGESWKSLGLAPLDRDSWTATFRIAKWDETRTTPFKAVYNETLRSGKEVESTWLGTIKANPVGRPLRMAALTCQNDYGFPYAPVAENVAQLDPDLVYFSGDQIYEEHGGYGLIRRPADRAILNYLRKYYMHGWAFREVMRSAPTLCIPDDHDVFQGNIWGEAGKPMADTNSGASSMGGYIEPARMVNAVHKTCVSHHPDCYDSTPIQQGISVYYGDMVYGNVSFAVLADRQFKSGPEHVDTGSGRADHVTDKNFDTAQLDKPGLDLLGQRQEEFLKQWVSDWRGHELKVVLSQTVFAGVATHHGAFDGYLKADLDSGAWPQTARNKTLEILRAGMPLHINGDQHLTSLAQYGIDTQRDNCWSFCTPAIAAGYPRWWRPDEVDMPHENRPEHGLPHTGEYIDGFGNPVYVYAVGYPEVATKKNRYERAHQKGSGFGFVTMDTKAKTYLIEAFRFLVDASDGATSNQFRGFPATIHQEENAGKNLLS